MKLFIYSNKIILQSDIFKTRQEMGFVFMSQLQKNSC